MERRFFITYFVVLALALLVTTIVTPGGASWQNAADLADYLLVTTVKTAASMIIAFLLNSVFFSYVFGMNWAEILGKARETNNQSHIVVFGANIVVATIMVAATPFTNLTQFIQFLLLKGTIGLALGTLLTFGAIRLFGIKSIREFREMVERPNNDNHAWIALFVMACSMVIAMTSFAPGP